jgi:hypothetical protein
MRRGPLTWILAVVGIVAVIVVAAAIGGRDKSDETVSAGEWAQSVCGAVGVWRGEMESIVEDVRTPGSSGATGTEEPQSETPQGRTSLIRGGLERAVQATETLVDGIDNAGVPDNPQGDEAANAVSGWADATRNDLEDAQDSLDKEADTIADSIDQLADAALVIGTSITSGFKVIADVARLDPELGDALRDSSTCQELREEES